MTRAELSAEEKKDLNHEAAYGSATALRFLLETSEPIIQDFQESGGFAEVIGSRIDKRQANRQRRLDNLSQPLLHRLLVPQPMVVTPPEEVEQVQPEIDETKQQKKPTQTEKTWPKDILGELIVID